MEADYLTILEGDAVANLRTLETGSVQCCVTSPPYWGLRDYSSNGQLGLEKTPEEYVCKMVEVFRGVRRVLRKDGTLWLNLGDSFASGKGKCYNPGGNTSSFNVHLKAENVHPLDRGNKSTLAEVGLKPKDLVGIPWRAAFALQADGWWLRSDIIWAKPNPMPESVTDRPTKSHEYLFLLTKSANYCYDADAIKEKTNGRELFGNSRLLNHDDRNDCARQDMTENWNRNKRSVWTVATAPYSEAHFATYPPDLVKPCIMAGTRVGDTVLDPFAGSGTTGMVALELGRKAILIELNPKYCDLIRQRCNVTPGLALA